MILFQSMYNTNFAFEFVGAGSLRKPNIRFFGGELMNDDKPALLHQRIVPLMGVKRAGLISSVVLSSNDFTFDIRGEPAPTDVKRVMAGGL